LISGGFQKVSSRFPGKIIPDIEEAFPGRMTGENDNTDWSDPAGFLLPGFSFYGILCQERNGSWGIPGSKPKRVLLLFCCF
jgi:hypothetical protein